MELIRDNMNISHPISTDRQEGHVANLVRSTVQHF